MRESVTVLIFREPGLQILQSFRDTSWYLSRSIYRFRDNRRPAGHCYSRHSTNPRPGPRDLDLIVFVNGGCVRSIEAVECALNCGKSLCRDEMRMRRQRPVGQIERVGVAFLDEGAAHGSVSGASPIRALPLAFSRTVTSSTRLKRPIIESQPQTQPSGSFSVLEGAGSGIIRSGLAGIHCLSEQGRAQNR